MCNVACALWIAFGEKSCEDLQQPDILASRCLSASYCCNWCLVKTTRARLQLVQKQYNFTIVKLYGFVWFSLWDYWEGAVVWFSESDVINCPGSRRLVCEVISRIIFQLDQIDHFKTCNIAFQVIFYIFRGEESAFNDLFDSKCWLLPMVD